MDKIRFDYSKAIKFINMHKVNHMEETVKYMHRMLHDRTGLGKIFLDGIEHPVNYDRESSESKSCRKIKSDSDALIVIGIGGSYLRARAVIEALNHSFTICRRIVSVELRRYILKVII